jgi:hypothetical protein
MRTHVDALRPISLHYSMSFSFWSSLHTSSTTEPMRFDPPRDLLTAKTPIVNKDYRKDYISGETRTTKLFVGHRIYGLFVRFSVQLIYVLLFTMSR